MFTKYTSSEHFLILMLAQIACNVLNTPQGLEYIQELWPFVMRITGKLSTLQFQKAYRLSKAWIHLPPTPYTHPTYLSRVS
jgi:hypothetical protein